MSDPPSESPQYACREHWLTALWNLTRWLRANGCWDYASPLEEIAQSFPPLPNLEVESKALSTILDRLGVVCNYPPHHLTPAQRKHLREIHAAAVESVLNRQRQVASEKANENRIIIALKQRIAAMPKDVQDDPARTALEARQGTNANSQTGKPSNQWTRQGPLGLTLNTNTHTVERNGSSVSFGSNGRQWEVFVKLAQRHPARYLVKDLGHEVWNPEGKDIDPDDNLVHQAITTVRQVLSTLGIGVDHKRNLGYVLSDNSAEPAPTSKRAKPRRKRH